MLTTCAEAEWPIIFPSRLWVNQNGREESEDQYVEADMALSPDSWPKVEREEQRTKALKSNSLYDMISDLFFHLEL